MTQAFFCKVLNDNNKENIPNSVNKSKIIKCNDFSLSDLIPTLRSFYTYNSDSTCSSGSFLNTIVFSNKLNVSKKFLKSFINNILTLPKYNTIMNSSNEINTIPESDISFYEQSEQELVDDYNKYINGKFAYQWECSLKPAHKIKKKSKKRKSKTIKEGFAGMSDDEDEADDEMKDDWNDLDSELSSVEYKASKMSKKATNLKKDIEGSDKSTDDSTDESNDESSNIGSKIKMTLVFLLMIPYVISTISIFNILSKVNLVNLFIVNYLVFPLFSLNESENSYMKILSIMIVLVIFGIMIWSIVNIWISDKPNMILYVIACVLILYLIISNIYAVISIDELKQSTGPFYFIVNIGLTLFGLLLLLQFNLGLPTTMSLFGLIIIGQSYYTYKTMDKKFLFYSILTLVEKLHVGYKSCTDADVNCAELIKYNGLSCTDADVNCAELVKSDELTCADVNCLNIVKKGDLFCEETNLDCEQLVKDGEISCRDIQKDICQNLPNNCRYDPFASECKTLTSMEERQKTLNSPEQHKKLLSRVNYKYMSESPRTAGQGTAGQSPTGQTGQTGTEVPIGQAGQAGTEVPGISGTEVSGSGTVSGSETTSYTTGQAGQAGKAETYVNQFEQNILLSATAANLANKIL